MTRKCGHSKLVPHPTSTLPGYEAPGKSEQNTDNGERQRERDYGKPSGNGRIDKR